MPRLAGRGKAFPHPATLTSPERIPLEPAPRLPGHRFRAGSGEAKRRLKAKCIGFPERLHPDAALPREALDGLPQMILRRHRQHNKVTRLQGLREPCPRLKAGMGRLHQLLGERKVRPHQNVGMPDLSVRHGLPPYRWPLNRRTPQHPARGAAAVPALLPASQR